MVSGKVYVLSLTILTFTTCITYGQDASNSDLAKQAQNPVANLISLPLQNNTNFSIGPDDETQNILNIQPVWPVSINDNWNLITRTILPVVSQPGILTGGQGRTNGLGDTTFTGFFSPKNSSPLTWGGGPVLLFPTATDDVLGSDKWGAGPSVVLLTMPGTLIAKDKFRLALCGHDAYGIDTVRNPIWTVFWRVENHAKVLLKLRSIGFKTGDAVGIDIDTE